MKDTPDHRRGPNIWFYQVGIGGKDETNSAGWKLRTLQTLIRENNDTSVSEFTLLVLATFDTAMRWRPLIGNHTLTTN